MITYEPLKRTLATKDLRISFLRDHGFHPELIAKINRNEYLTLVQLERICLILEVPIENVVQVVPEKE